MSLLQNRLIAHGWTTARVLAPAQDLKSGHLTLAVIPGKIRHVTLTDNSRRGLWLYSAFPAHDGNLLDLRDIEQGLENLQRLPTVQVEMDIVPAEQPGESDIVITRQQSKFWRLGLSLDDSGSSSTGRYQGGLTLSLDNPLALSDLFWFSMNHDLQTGPEKGNQNLSAHWSVPVGWWAFSVTGSDYHYHQTVAGLNGDIRYSGKSQSLVAQASRVLHRSSAQKPRSPGTWRAGQRKTTSTTRKWKFSAATSPPGRPGFSIATISARQRLMQASTISAARDGLAPSQPPKKRSMKPRRWAEFFAPTHA